MSVADLAAALTINSQTVYPTFRYIGGDANATNWTADGYGETLTAAGSGGSFNQGSPLLGTDDDSVNGNGTRYYQESGTTEGNVSTNDMVPELVFKTTGTTSVLCAKRNTGVGWEVGIDSSARLYLTVQDSSGASTVTSTALAARTWYYAIIFADRSGSAQIYLNAIASGSAVAISSRALTLDSATSLTALADSGGSGIYDANVAYVSMWHSAAWLDTHLQATVAQDRFQRLCGLYPQLATGTADWTSYTRATTAHLDIIPSTGVHKLYRVGAGWPRVCERYESDGVTERVGYLSESAATNLITNSEDISAASWNKIRVLNPPDTNTAVAPDGNTTADTIKENGDNNTHYISASYTQAASTTYIYGVRLKAINREWAYLAVYSATDGSVASYFQLSGDGVLGNNVGCDDRGIKKLGDGWYHCWIKEARTTAESGTFYVFIAASNGVSSFQGLNQDSLYVWGSEIKAEDGAVPTSYIYTSGGTATRNIDLLRYKGDDGNINDAGAIGAISCRFMSENLGGAAGAGNFLWDLTDGGSASDRIACYADATGVVKVETAATAGNPGAITGTVNVVDGDEHEIMVSWKANELRLFIDGTEDGTADTSVDVPNDLDRIDLGVNYAGGWACDGIVKDVKIYDANREA